MLNAVYLYVNIFGNTVFENIKNNSRLPWLLDYTSVWNYTNE